MVEIKNYGVGENGNPITMYTIVNPKGHFVRLLDDGPSIVEYDLPEVGEEDLSGFNSLMKSEQKVIVSGLGKDWVSFSSRDGSDTVTLSLNDNSCFTVRRDGEKRKNGSSDDRT